MRIYDRIAKIVAWTPKSNILLDLGCDRGDITQLYSKKAKKVYGLDNNKEAISYAKKKYKQVAFVHAEGEKIPFKKNYFDTVIMGEVLEHVYDEKKTIDEVYRVLKPGGTLLISVPHKGMFRFIDSFNMKFYFPRLYRWWKGKKFDPKVYEIQPWHRHYSLHDLKKLFGKKFIIKKVYRGGFLLYPLIWVCGDALSDLFGKRANAIRNMFAKIAHLEYQISFGSAAASIIIYAKKEENNGFTKK